eukprot:NODE_75_length_23373_cov_0.434261.p6 type:complete len:325 gc:universal NODE_75_length_23373_cov_0.434261:13980-14954(+)
MHIIYGKYIRKESGVEKTLKKVLPPLSKFLEMFEKERHFNRSPLLEIVDKAVPAIRGISAIKDAIGDKMNDAHIRRASSFGLIPLDEDSLQSYRISVNKSSYLLGEAVIAAYSIPHDHSKYDWIGVYKCKDEEEKDGIRVSTGSSKGCWMYLWGNKSYDNDGKDIKLSDVVIFDVDTMLFEVGEYELRIHYDNSHRVLCKSLPFKVECNKIDLTIKLESLDYDVVTKQVAEELLLHSRNILLKPELKVTDDLILVGDLQEKQAKQICILISKIYGVDIACRAIGEVLDTVETVAEKICEYVVEVGLKSFVVRARSRSPGRQLNK